MSKRELPPLSKTSQSIIIGGLYEHYKKKRYKVLSIARHSESLEEMVVYQALYGDEGVWVRPVSMFLENVSVNGHLQPRFTLYKE